MENLKTHWKGIRKVFFCYALSVVLSWAAFPLIAIVLSGYATPDLCFSIYTAISTVVLCIITYLSLHGFGESDRKPYKWARYPAKGFVCAAIACTVILLLEYLIITWANRSVIVSHPQFVIETLNAYVRIALCMPFYWLFRLLEGPVGEVCPIPSVTYGNCLLIAVFVLSAASFGYWMGFTDRRIFKKEIQNGFLRKLLYPKPKRVRREEKQRRKAERKKV